MAGTCISPRVVGLICRSLAGLGCADRSGDGWGWCLGLWRPPSHSGGQIGRWGIGNGWGTVQARVWSGPRRFVSMRAMMDVGGTLAVSQDAGAAVFGMEECEDGLCW